MLLKSDLLIGKTSQDCFDDELVIFALIPLPSVFSLSVDVLLSGSFLSPFNFSSNLDFSRFFGKMKKVLLKEVQEISSIKRSVRNVVITKSRCEIVQEISSNCTCVKCDVINCEIVGKAKSALA